jgi:hypothetical protein
MYVKQLLSVVIKSNPHHNPFHGVYKDVVEIFLDMTSEEK